jgi:hypothetical protein
MYGEFTINVKRCKDHEVMDALRSLYPSNDLENAYQKSRFKETANRYAFSFGYQNQDVLLLAQIADGELNMTVENLKDKEDLIQLKNRIDKYHNQIRKGLERRKLYTHRSSALLTLGKTEINGEWPDKFRDFWEGIRKKGEKIFIEPFSALIVSFFALHYKIFDAKEYSDDVKKTLTILAEAYVGVIAFFLVKFFSRNKEKKFKFVV